MRLPQPGIFALGTASHAYLELDRRAGVSAERFVGAVADLEEPQTTIGGVNVIVGFRPELWREAAPDDAPAGLRGFDEPVTGSDGFSMPATQHDLWLWVAGAAYDVVFDTARAAVTALESLATVAHEVASWPYRHDRDLTGFVDGSANPSVSRAPDAVLVPDGQPGAGGSVVLVQQWAHDAPAWEALGQERQERAMGRRKPDSVELDEDDMPQDSHVARTDQEDFGEIFRRNTPYGIVTDHGTMFVGFSPDQERLAQMLESMAGVGDGVRDALTRYTRALTGAYYFVPSVQSLARFASPEAEED